MSKKRIVVGVSGGIAAYKACDLVSKLSKKDYEVKVILTKHAEKFVSKLTFEALCHNYVETDLFDESNEDPIAHITLAKWADLMIIVPATANIIAKITHGISDDLLSTTFLACNKHKMICPAMNTQMYENPITQKNIQACKDLGYQILDPVVGHLACNDTGSCPECSFQISAPGGALPRGRWTGPCPPAGCLRHAVAAQCAPRRPGGRPGSAPAVRARSGGRRKARRPEQKAERHPDQNAGQMMARKAG